MSLHICQTCQHKEQSNCYGGCRCLLDGRPLLDHVMQQSCPAGKFGVARSLDPFAAVPATPVANNTAAMAPAQTLTQSLSAMTAVPSAAGSSLLSRLGHGAKGLAKAALGIDRTAAFRLEFRRQACDACPHAQRKLGLVDTCQLCGCVIQAKIVIASQSCLAGKW